MAVVFPPAPIKATQEEGGIRKAVESGRVMFGLYIPADSRCGQVRYNSSASFLEDMLQKNIKVL
jgi:hypothetical protein